MANPHHIPGALEELQDSIYRERVLRAREMSPGERADAVFNLSELQLNMLLAGEMNRHQLSDEAAGWQKVSEALARRDAASEKSFYALRKAS